MLGKGWGVGGFAFVCSVRVVCWHLVLVLIRVVLGLVGVVVLCGVVLGVGYVIVVICVGVVVCIVCFIVFCRVCF